MAENCAAGKYIKFLTEAIMLKLLQRFVTKTYQ